MRQPVKNDWFLQKHHHMYLTCNKQFVSLSITRSDTNENIYTLFLESPSDNRDKPSGCSTTDSIISVTKHSFSLCNCSTLFFIDNAITLTICYNIFLFCICICLYTYSFHIPVYVNFPLSIIITTIFVPLYC